MTNSNQLVIRNLQTLLKFTFGLVPIVAGADKFTNILTHWEAYLAPGLASMLPFAPATFMMIVGVIEIVAGILVLIRPAVGALVVSAWLVCIALTLIFSWRFVDVAVRDLVMAIGAYGLAVLTRVTTNTSAA